MANDNKNTDTPFIQWMRLMNLNMLKAVPSSRERASQVYDRAIILAVEAGFPFATEDFQNAKGCNLESAYCSAVIGGNIRAAQSIEHALGRPPFILDNVDPGHWNTAGLHMTGDRVRGRLARGFKFPWKGEKVTVTSFSDDGTSVVACSYYEPKRDSRGHKTGPAKIRRRFTITRGDIVADRAERKKAMDVDHEPEET